MATFFASNSQEISTALARARPGDVVELAPGEYGNVSVRNVTFSDRVTIRSADAANPAHFSTLAVKSVAHVSFEGVAIGRPLAADEPNYTKMATVYDSSQVQFRNVHFFSSLDGNAQNDGMGLLISGSRSVTVEQSEFEQLRICLYVEKSIGTRIVNNSFHDIGKDGMNVAGSSNTVIDGNTFDRFFPLLGDHPDAIQLYNTNMPTGSSDISIINNVMLQTGGQGPQGIWVSDPGQFGYKNILIRNNLMYGNDQWNGITVNGGTGVTIADNSVLSTSQDTKKFWIRLQDSSDVALSNNIADDIKIISGVSDIRYSNNVFLAKDPDFANNIPNLKLPTSVDDLVFLGIGYQAIAPSGSSPIAHALGSQLSSMLGKELDLGVVEVGRASAELKSIGVVDSFDLLHDSHDSEAPQAEHPIASGGFSGSPSDYSYGGPPPPMLKSYLNAYAEHFALP